MGLVQAHFASVILGVLQAIRLMRPGVEQWVIVSDFHGFGFGDLSPRMATAFLEVSAKHYPERLCAFLVRGRRTLHTRIRCLLNARSTGCQFEGQHTQGSTPHTCCMDSDPRHCI